MTFQAFWFRDLEAAGKGPDWIFSAWCAPERAAMLSAIFRTLQPYGFTYYRAIQAQCPIHLCTCDYDLYIDNHQYAAVIAQLEGRHEQNLYVYHTFQACQTAVQLVRGYGGYPDQHGSEETRCIRTLAETSELMISSWRISYGGVTYPYEDWIAGNSAAELVRYLDQQGTTTQ